MRGDAETHQMVAPGTLAGVLELIASEPGAWTPIAGGTELMVAHAAGRLPASRLVSLWGIADLRFIASRPENIIIGAGATFTDIRNHADIDANLPLLARAATWIGSIANQSRATIGGNLVNGSPAADSSPALLVYDAEVELLSVRGTRRIRYCDFHTGYKKTALAPDELLYAIHIPRRFADHRQYFRKVGTRRAMAISKVALGATALIKDGIITELRLAAASLAPFPTRLYRTEDSLSGKRVDTETKSAARRALLAEVLPIDDIRSTAEYRRHVAANLLDEFLTDLERAGSAAMSPVLAAWNQADESVAMKAILACCAARRWAQAIVARRPYVTLESLGLTANEVWSAMEEPDWLEAFAAHPRIGERKAPSAKTTASAWSEQEQSSTASAAQQVLADLAAGNAQYEKRFGFTYIVCATGKSAEEMLAILQRRLVNDRATELREAAEQQRRIMQIRIRKWLVE